MTDDPNGTKNPLEVAMEMQHKDLALKVVALEEENTTIRTENDSLRKMLVKAKDVIESDIAARKKVQIMDKSIFTVEDLDGKNIIELDAILEHISKAKKPFKPIADESDNKTANPTLDGLFAPWKNK